MTQESDAAEVISAIDAQFTSPLAVDIDDAAKQVGNHVIVFLSRRYVDGKMIDGSVRAAGGRLVTRYVGRTVGDVRVMRQKTTTALEDRFLASVGPFSFETEQESLAYDSDDGGWYVAADAWIF